MTNFYSKSWSLRILTRFVLSLCTTDPSLPINSVLISIKGITSLVPTVLNWFTYQVSYLCDGKYANERAKRRKKCIFLLETIWKLRWPVYKKVNMSRSYNMHLVWVGKIGLYSSGWVRVIHCFNGLLWFEFKSHTSRPTEKYRTITPISPILVYGLLWFWI
jgi:hypothetical protein